MAISNAERLGQELGTQNRRVDEYKQDFVENDTVEDFSLISVENVEASEVVLVTKKLFPSNALILDHPVYSELDNSTLLTDQTYSSSVTLYDSRT